MADVGAAAAADDLELRQFMAKRDVPLGEVGGIARVERLGLVELGVAAGGPVRPQPADPRAGVSLGQRVGAVRRQLHTGTASCSISGA